MSSLNKKNQIDSSHESAIRCDCCNNSATKTHFVLEAGGDLDVCDKCDYILSLQDEISELKKSK